MASATKEAFAKALKQMMLIKPIDKITVKDLVELCNVNRQTFYYHFDDVYDLLKWTFERDFDNSLPSEVTYEHWQDDVLAFFTYLCENRAFALNIYNSGCRRSMLRFLREKLEARIRSFAGIITADKGIERGDFEFIVDFYSAGVTGIISQCLDADMVLPADFTEERLLTVFESSFENIAARFQNKRTYTENVYVPFFIDNF